jgi:hypothetical protein
MLDRLMLFGIEKGFFEEKPLGELEKSCCPCAKTVVIDFDKAKEKILKETSCQQPKSADAIKILPHLSRIDFIEMKGWEQFIIRTQDKNNFSKETENHIDNLRLSTKIRDSLNTLWIFVKDKNLRCSNLEFSQYEQAEKNYFVVVDIDLYQDPMKDRAIALGFLSQNLSKQKVLNALKKDVDGISESNLENLKKPRILNCREIDQFYDKENGGIQTNSINLS